MPVWNNPLFDIPYRAFVSSWRYELELNSVKDTFKVGVNEEYTDADILTYFRATFEEEDGWISVSQGRQIHEQKLLNQWRNILKSIPSFITKAARGQSSEFD